MFDPENLSSYPKECGVYLMKDAEDNVLYIGKAKNLKARLKQYFEKTDTRPIIPFLVPKIVKIDTIVTLSEKEALLLENSLIKQHQPKYNALLKDDKTFASLMINHKHPWPMLKLVRYKGQPPKDGLYFGPYTSSLAAKETLDVLSKIFPLRQCSDHELASRKRPCILYSIKRCLAPCAGKCNKDEYDLLTSQVIEFLKGKDKEVIKTLETEMESAADLLDFEKAAHLLHTIEQLKKVIVSSKSLVERSPTDCDVIALYRQGTHVLLVLLTFREGKLISSDHFDFTTIGEDDEELIESFLLQHNFDSPSAPNEILLQYTPSNHKLLMEILSQKFNTPIKIITPEKGNKKQLIELAESNAKSLFYQEKRDEAFKENLLQHLQDALSLARYPMRIECFDTSNLSGTHPVAALIAFYHGKKDRSRYRTYKIKGDYADDYRVLREVLLRRYKKAKELGDLPDLIIVDGGKGQLNIAHEILESLEIASCDLIALAKEDARHDKGLSQEKIFLLNQSSPILLPKHSPILFLLQQIRDEAHRKAITFQKKQRHRSHFSSPLDQIPGIGPVKKKRLLQYFGSIEGLKQASKEDIQTVPGLSSKDIDHVLAFTRSLP